MSRTLYLEVLGIPAPKGSVSAFPIKRGEKWGTVVTHGVKSKKWEKTVLAEAKTVTPLVGAISAELWFFMPRPKSVKRFYPAVVPDIDKLARAVLDGLKEVWEDDARVVDLVTHERYATEDFPSGVLVHLQEKMEDQYELEILKACRAQWRADAGN